jgi:hypothetical protein
LAAGREPSRVYVRAFGSFGSFAAGFAPLGCCFAAAPFGIVKPKKETASSHPDAARRSMKK